VGTQKGILMADLNLCVFTGRLGRDPELRNLSNGEASCSSSIAVSRKWKDKNSGEQKEQTTWVPLSFYGKTAELFCKYCTKGSQVRITGEFSVRKYTDKDGNEKQITEVKVQDLQLLGGNPNGQSGGGQAPAARPAAVMAPWMTTFRLPPASIHEDLL
jgi:single-strand DNA-binding protein